MASPFTQTFVTAHDRAAESIRSLLMLVPVEVDSMNFKLHPNARVLHELIRHLQQSELYYVRGAVQGHWDMGDVKWYVGKNQPMADQFMANHREAMMLLAPILDEELLQRQVTLSYMKGNLADILFHNLDHLQHHRSQLFDYLKALNQPVDSRSIWGEKYPV